MKVCTKKWICMVCSYVHQGENPPETCPVCNASKSEIKELEP